MTSRFGFSSLRSRTEHVRVNRQLAALFRRAGARAQRSRLYEGTLPTLYLPAEDIWLAAHSLHNRYRNALGVGDPRGARELSPSIQLNLAHAPGSARPHARFVRDAGRRIWVAHDGTLGGRVPGISRDAFIAFVGNACEITIDDVPSTQLVLGTYEQPAALLAAIGRLVHAAYAFRSAVAAGAAFA